MQYCGSQLYTLQRGFEEVWAEVKGEYAPSVHTDVQRRLAQLMVDLTGLVPIASRAQVVDAFCRECAEQEVKRGA